MKKILCLVCCLSLMLSPISIPVVYATNTLTQTTRDAQGLWYVENLTLITGSQNAVVTPTQGSNLNIWLLNDGPIRVQVYKTNAFGGYSSVYNNVFQAGERDFNVATNCNGQNYLVKFSVEGPTTISALIYQH